VSGLSKDFFTDIKIATSVNPFSRAAANVNRNEVYAAHNSCGKATVWLTVSPRDDLSFDVMWYALGPAQSAPHKDQLPLGSLRFATLNQHPVAAALQFEHILDVVVEHVIGWSREKHMPHARGGLFGIPKAWVFAVEEQGRLTLHTHILIWSLLLLCVAVLVAVAPLDLTMHSWPFIDSGLLGTRTSSRRWTLRSTSTTCRSTSRPSSSAMHLVSPQHRLPRHPNQPSPLLKTPLLASPHRCCHPRSILWTRCSRASRHAWTPSAAAS
jgi:hypothetical protein